METLALYLSQNQNLELTIVTVAAGYSDIEFRENNISYIVIGTKKKFFHWNSSKSELQKCVSVVEKKEPDLIHIHGTELEYGLLSARNMVKCPTVISIQGLIEPCSTHILGNFSFWGSIKNSTLIEIIRGTSLAHQYISYIKRGEREIEIIKKNQVFLGRTFWDKSYISTINPESRYLKCGEILRPPFFKSRWRIETCEKYSVIFTNVSGPLKGADVLINAIKVLKKDFPQVKLKLAGHINDRTGYGKYLKGLFFDAGISDCIEVLGYINAEEMASYLSETHVFAIASHIENSPNSLGEAQLVGMPCVASYVGGIPSMVTDRVDGLLFPCGDYVMLAACIKKIFENNEFAKKMGDAAHGEAIKRHDPNVIINDLLAAYHTVLNGE